MRTIDIKTPDGKTLSLNAPDDATPEQIHGAVQAAVSHYKGQGTQPQNNAAAVTPEAVNQASDPSAMLKMAAPSNLGKMAGVAAANAPGIASLAVNSLPGIGNPSAIMPAMQNIKQNPGQLNQAVNRVAATQGGGDMAPGDEANMGHMGQAAGTAIEMMGPPGLNKGVKPSGPFTAGVNTPETALPGALTNANQELGAAKLAAKAGDSIEETDRLRRLMDRPAGVAKVADEAVKALRGDAKDLSVTALLAYRKAAGAMQSQGGEFANTYKETVDKASELLAKKAPDVSKALAKSRVNFQAEDGSEFRMPALTMAVDHGVGVAKMAVNAAKTAGVRNTVGAAIGASMPALPAMADIANMAYDKVFNRKKKKGE